MLKLFGKELLNWFSTHSLLGSIILLIFIFWARQNWIALNDGDKPESQNRRLQWLSEDRYGELYLRFIGWLLDKTSNLIGDQSAFPKEKPVYKKIYSFNPWTAASFRFSLMLSLFYPILTFLLFWALGSTGQFGTTIDFDEGLELLLSQRALFIIYILSIILTIIWVLRKKGWKRLLSLGAIIAVNSFLISKIPSTLSIWGLLFTQIIILSLIFSFIYCIGWSTNWLITRAYKKAHQSVILYAVSVSITLTFIFAFSFITPSTLTNDFISIAVLISVVTITFTIAVTDVFTIAGSFAAITAIAIVLVAAIKVQNTVLNLGYGFDFFIAAAISTIAYVLMNLTYESSQKDIRSARLFWWKYCGALLYIVYILIGNVQEGGLMMLLIFYLLFPLINASIDWLSLGVTRGLLQAIRSGHHSALVGISWVFVDLLFALFLFLLVSALIVMSICFANSVAGTDVFDVQEVLKNIRKNPSNIDFYWIYFSLFSTLIPTLFHFALASAAATLWAPKRLRHWIVVECDKSHDKLVLGWVYLTLTPVIGFILVPYFLFSLGYWLLITHGAVLLNQLLGLMEVLALAATFS